MAKNYVTFLADFPDDSEWTEAGDLVTPRGKVVAEAIAAKLAGESVECSQPKPYSFYGWAFEAGSKTRARCVIQYLEPWLLICNHLPTVADRLLGRRAEAGLQEFLGALAQALQGDSRFSSVKWFTREEYEASPEARGERA